MVMPPNPTRTGKARDGQVRDLEAICRELECLPGDLLEWRGRIKTSLHRWQLPPEERSVDVKRHYFKRAIRKKL